MAARAPATGTVHDMQLLPRHFPHPFTPDSDSPRPGTCGVALEGRACELPASHDCHQQPLTYPRRRASEPAAARVRTTDTEPAGPDVLADDTQRPPLATSPAYVAALEDLLTTLMLYVAWRPTTRPLTTEQKNIWADLIDAEHAWRDQQEGTAGTDRSYGLVDRWWQD